MQPDQRIIEGIVTTLAAGGAPNVAPMGPITDATFQRLKLRPFQTSATFRNLVKTGEGVFHVTDDVELLARAAIGAFDEPPPMQLAEVVAGAVLKEACRWYEFRVTNIDDRSQRAEIDVEVVHQERIRDFLGFNRAKHAVVEAAILATRVEILPSAEIREQLQHLTSLVEKTAADSERSAFALLEAFIDERLAASTL